MNMQLIQKIQNKFKKQVPVVRPGNTVRIHQKIKEGGKERIQIFEGLVIAVNSGSGSDKTFTVRKVVGNIGVEKIFPLYSTNITKIQVTKAGNVRRSKLYYMRKRSGKSARLREKHLTEKEVIMEDFEEDVPETAQEEAATEETAENTEATQPEETTSEESDSVTAEKAEDTPTEGETQTEDTAQVEEDKADEKEPKE